jgi:hypothetical protein
LQFSTTDKQYCEKASLKYSGGRRKIRHTEDSNRPAKDNINAHPAALPSLDICGEPHGVMAEWWIPLSMFAVAASNVPRMYGVHEESGLLELRLYAQTITSHAWSGDRFVVEVSLFQNKTSEMAAGVYLQQSQPRTYICKHWGLNNFLYVEHIRNLEHFLNILAKNRT